MLLFNCLACYFFAVNVCDFNTSNVTIQLLCLICPYPWDSYFNTSNVTIQPKFQHHRKGLYLNFNTSNVTIQLSLSSPTMSFLYISIHLMLLFNYTAKDKRTGYVIISIHLMLLFNTPVDSKFDLLV